MNFSHTLRFLGSLILTGALLSCDSQHPSAISEIESPAGNGSGQPHLTLDHLNQPVLSWLEPYERAHILFYSTLIAEQWTPPRQVSIGEDWFINWADFPSVTPITESLWTAHWLQKSSGGTYAYDVMMSLSADAGKSWQTPFSPHSDGTLTEHGFVSLFNWQASAGAVWLDGRNMEGGQSHDNHATHGAGMTIRSASILENGKIEREHIIDDLVCECCQTDAAVTSDGPVVIYRNRTTDEIRDIYISRYTDGSWTEGQPIANDNWHIEGCPVNGPAIAAQDNQVAIAWFTGANDQPRVRVVQSVDAGKTFSGPVDLDMDKPIGRVDIVLLQDGTPVVSWVRRDHEGEGVILAQKIKMPLGSPFTISAISVSRPSGFPQMVRADDQLVFAWTHIEDNESTVRTSQVNVSAFD